MQDDRTRGWLLVRLLLAIAVLATIAIPVLAPPTPMSGLGYWEGMAYRFGPIVAEALAITGLIWMVRIWRAGGRDAASAWRYRDVVEPTPVDGRRDEAPTHDRPLADTTRAPGWLIVRLELAAAVIGVLVSTIILLTYQPVLFHDEGGERWHAAYQLWSVALPYVGEALAIAGLLWMIRIWRGPTGVRQPAWRYRD